tara:strand:+ start:46 stop:933 length:888 start_codon:yes stop_codon:yes gene_type:complete
MEEIDLDLNNYNLNDILNLFSLKHNFTIEDIKSAKKKVLLLHPDKSNLNIEYFYFFSKAYRILLSIYEFKNKNIDKNNNNIEYLADKNDDNNKILDNITKDIDNSTNFNNWFNKLFEENRLKNDFNDTGYGDWLKSNDNINNIECKNLSEINKHIEDRKKKLRNNTLTKHKDITDTNINQYSDIINSVPDSYGSNMFSKLQYEDLRIAHEESVVPVTQEDFKSNYNNIDDIKNVRQHMVNPLSKDKANEILNKEKNKDHELTSYRGYILAKQQEEVEDINKKWWSSLKQLKNTRL